MTRLPRSRLSVGVLAAVLLATVSCGNSARDSDSARDVLAATAKGLRDVRSARMVFDVQTSSGTTKGFGFRLEGPFEVQDGELPEAELEYTQRAGTKEGSTTFLSTGERAYVVVDGAAYELPEDQTKGLSGENAGGAGLGTLQLEEWMIDPKVTDGPVIDGVETDHVTARLRAGAALRDIAALAGGLGADSSVLSALADADLAEAAEQSTVELWTGADDDVLRRLVLTVRLSARPGTELPPAVKDLAPVTLALELTLSDINADVQVVAPPSPRPFSQLPRG
jgi:hypothetical protein